MCLRVGKTLLQEFLFKGTNHGKLISACLFTLVKENISEMPQAFILKRG